MNYGYFDDARKEYVITRPDTPGPWANYLGSPEYGAVITNAAGGYSFEKSGANGRIIRYVFNAFDEPGRYIYLRDNDTGDYWSASWQPVGKPLEQYKSVCRHGTAYTVMEAEYAGIRSEACYYVPLNRTHEVWHLKVKNTGDARRSLTVSGYAEFTNENNYEQDQVNLQYSMFITSTEFRGNRVRNLINGNHDGVEGRWFCERFFGLAGAEVSSFCGDKDAFLGRYRRYGNPIGIETGDLGGKLNYCRTSCGALSTVLTLEPGEERELCFLLGMKKDPEAAALMERYADPKTVCAEEAEELKRCWHARLDALQVHTPSPEFNSMLNTWHAYNCFITFIWSRAASLIYCGLRNGYGYRDTVQDIQGIIHLDPEMAAEKIRFMLSAQVESGAGLPLVKFTHNPGHEDTPDDPSYVKETGHPAYRADDAMWLFPTVYKYVAESGNLAFLDEVIPFANRGEGTVYEHLKRAVEFTENHLGSHGMPAGLYADWNDCLRLGAAGESTFVAFQFRYAIFILRQFAEYKQDRDYIVHLDSAMASLEDKLQRVCWNEDRFIRGITEDGEVIGKRDNPEANLWLNPQSWSVISGFASREQAEKAMENVHERLNTPYGAIVMDPPFRAHAFDGALMVIFNRGVKENAGIFLQPQGWLILAEALLGHGNRAFAYYLESCPAAQNDDADRRMLEPYCYGQFTEGNYSPEMGRSHVHWLTGTASTVMVGCTEGILGLRPDIGGLRLSPAIPKEWDGFTMDKSFRGCRLHVAVHNPGHRESGFVRMTVNGSDVGENYIPASLLKPETAVELWIS